MSDICYFHIFRKMNIDSDCDVFHRKWHHGTCELFLTHLFLSQQNHWSYIHLAQLRKRPIWHIFRNFHFFGIPPPILNITHEGPECSISIFSSLFWRIKHFYEYWCLKKIYFNDVLELRDLHQSENRDAHFFFKKNEILINILIDLKSTKNTSKLGFNHFLHLESP